MAQFAKTSFDAAGYLASRPTYPARAYDLILSYHRQRGGRTSHALDLGCGPGFMALNLAPHFESVTGLDPSSKMVAVGVQPPSGPKIRYGVGTSEDLGAAGIAPASVDLVVAGQAAHWFDHAKTWPQLARALRPGGSVAYIGYGELTFPKYPHLNALVTRYHHDGAGIGPHWSQPGRSIVEGLLDRVPFPVTPDFDASLLSALPDIEHDEPGVHPVADVIAEPEATPTPTASNGGFEWDPTTAVRLKAGSEGPWFIHRQWTAKDFEAYLRTSSAVAGYQEAHPDDKAKRRSTGGDGDIVDLFVDEVRDALKKEGVDFDKEPVHCAYPLVLVLIKKKQQ
ncbi:Trans-aconitate 3-methyltransferase [Vanrija pseudolonga]|uniref:Trans-aconitate 3-methyltransferase n=1 Tax=Vanrija pseudolonga TaxID=143232 RepID=A0AAF1BIU1_9TREE|nr:Trans-aconitate 3-methyltransferase [Vanrija pseudolonga]